MRLTPNRARKVLERWDEVTAPIQDSAFSGYLLMSVVAAVLLVAIQEWWLAALFFGLGLLFLRMLWERPNSKVRRLFDALNRRTD